MGSELGATCELRLGSPLPRALGPRGFLSGKRAHAVLEKSAETKRGTSVTGVKRQTRQDAGKRKQKPEKESERAGTRAQCPSSEEVTVILPWTLAREMSHVL